MKARTSGSLALAFLISSGLACPVLAQSATPAPGAAAAPPEATAKPSRRARAEGSPAVAQKEPTVGQLAGRERMRKCGAEWRALSVSAKAEAGPKWPQFLSKCVKRLKEQKA